MMKSVIILYIIILYYITELRAKEANATAER